MARLKNPGLCLSLIVLLFAVLHQRTGLANNLKLSLDQTTSGSPREFNGPQIFGNEVGLQSLPSNPASPEVKITSSHKGVDSKLPEDSNEHGHYSQHQDEKHEYHVFSEEFHRVEIPFIIALWIFVSSLAKIGFHMTPKLHLIFPESCLLIVVGIIIGFLLYLSSENPPSTLTPDVFFLFMLPPIILDAGYFMPNRLFFDHLGTIILMAVVGTIFNTLSIGVALWAVGQTGLYGEHDTPGILETFLFSSLISAVDPVAVLAVFEEIQVNEVLYIVVFGESLLNDAVTVVLYHMFQEYVKIEEEHLEATDVGKGFASFLVVAGGGTIIGIIWGYATGFVTRFTHHAPVLEPLFVFTMAYLSYLNAEIFHMSGILAITFCGITMKNYVERNVSTHSQTTIKYAMKMLSSSSETIIFMFLGVATIHDQHDWNWFFVILTILFCTVFRCVSVLILSAIANQYRLHKLGMVDQFVMMYGGLRGAVAFALVLTIDSDVVPHAHMFVTTTIAVIYWTVFVQGITIKPLVRILNVKTSSEKSPNMNERITGRFMDHVVSGMEGILGEFGNLKIREIYREIDRKYIKPCLLREKQVKDPKILDTYEAITNNDVVEFIKRKASNLHEMQPIEPGIRYSKSSTILAPIIQAENLDLKEIIFSQTMKDLAEARIHHLLSESLYKPQGRIAKLTYSRHQLDEIDTKQIGYKQHAQVRRMMSEKRAKRRTVKYLKTNDEDSQQVPDKQIFRVIGSEKQLLDDKLHQLVAWEEFPEIEEMEGGIVFSTEDDDQTDNGAANPTSIGDNSYKQNNRKPSSDPSKSRSVSVANPNSEIRQLVSQAVTMPDLHKPEWMQNATRNLHSNDRGYENHGFESETGEGDEDRHPLETVLPWKRENIDLFCPVAMKQREFPTWIKNKEYITDYTMPSFSLPGVPEASDSLEPISEVSFDVEAREPPAHREVKFQKHQEKSPITDEEFLAALENKHRRVSLPGISSISGLNLGKEDERRHDPVFLKDRPDLAFLVSPVLRRAASRKRLKPSGLIGGAPSRVRTDSNLSGTVASLVGTPAGSNSSLAQLSFENELRSLQN